MLVLLIRSIFRLYTIPFQTEGILFQIAELKPN